MTLWPKDVSDPALGSLRVEGSREGTRASRRVEEVIATGEAIPLRGLEGVPGLPGAPQDALGSLRVEGQQGLPGSLTGCLEYPRDGGAWWAAFYGVTQSRTQLSTRTCTMIR